MKLLIGTARSRAKAKSLENAMNPVRQHLTDSLILESCRSVGHAWNQCLWNPVLTTLACVWKQLQPDASARQVEDWVASLDSELFTGRNDGADFCAARQRLPVQALKIPMQKIGKSISAKAGLYFKGMPVWIVDGTTLRTANTRENAKVFGRSCNQVRKSRSPILRLTLLVCAGCGAVLSAAMDAYACSEWELFLRMLLDFPDGGLLIADRAYSSYLMVALMRQRGSHVLTRHNSARRRMRRLQRYERGDALFEWDRPRPPHVSRPDLLRGCAKTVQVRIIKKDIRRRGYRTLNLQLATTLLDPKLYPADELIELYLRRWNIELDLRTLKTHYGLARLTGKTPDISYKEVYSTLLAYNCVVAQMGESGPAVRQLSHTRARELVAQYCERMAGAPTQRLPRLYQCLLALIAQAQLTAQERPPQPRALVQRSSTYPTLTMSRKAWQRSFQVA